MALNTWFSNIVSRRVFNASIKEARMFLYSLRFISMALSKTSLRRYQWYSLKLLWRFSAALTLRYYFVFVIGELLQDLTCCLKNIAMESIFTISVQERKKLFETFDCFKQTCKRFGVRREASYRDLLTGSRRRRISSLLAWKITCFVSHTSFLYPSSLYSIFVIWGLCGRTIWVLQDPLKIGNW